MSLPSSTSSSSYIPPRIYALGSFVPVSQRARMRAKRCIEEALYSLRNRQAGICRSTTGLSRRSGLSSSSSNPYPPLDVGSITQTRKQNDTGPLGHSNAGKACIPFTFLPMDDPQNLLRMGAIIGRVTPFCCINVNVCEGTSIY